MSSEQVKARHRLAWGLDVASYVRHAAPELGAVAEKLIEIADPAWGASALDLGCGPGTATLPLARRVGPNGGIVGVDLAAPMVAWAERAAAKEGLAHARFAVGDLEDLGEFADASFDLVISNFGVIFAPDPERAAREMARAVRPGGRAALSAWLESDVTREYYDLVYQHIPRHPAPHDPYDWGVPARAVAWLGSAFAGIETRPLAVPFEAESVGAAWAVLNRSTGRVAAGYATLPADARHAFDDAMYRYFERFLRDDGSVFWPREALLVRGRRPVPRSGAAGEIFI
jgi:SAM-dependent methyltransferase